MSRVLLLRDDAVLGKSMQSSLEENGFDVVVLDSGKDGLKRVSNEQFDLYLLDINAPYMDSYDFLDQVRKTGDRTPAFFVTALKDLALLSRGYDTGIDDYIKKPFEMSELVIRISAIIKKRYDFLEYGALRYDSLNKRVLLNSKEIGLTYVERHIFDLMVRNLGENISKEQFFSVMERPSEMALRVHINKLKHKLNIAIKNVRSIGYRLEKI